MSKVELLPTKATYSPSEPIVVEVRGVSKEGVLKLWHLGQLQQEIPYTGQSAIEIGALEAGGYGIELEAGDARIRTAVEVSSDARSRLRYGFVADFSPERDLSAVSDNIRRLHLSAVMFYDWAYRHADLMGGGENYFDALNQPVSLKSVRALVNTVQASGASALGYAAVYAVGPKEWPQWEHLALLDPTGKAYGLGDFLFVLDPAATQWTDHFVDDLKHATKELGFDGYHLDQYGYPKRALRADGVMVDVGQSFDTLITRVRIGLPESQLVFNNVNDFPTWVTAHSPQNGIYIEVWEPHLTLETLATVVTRAKSLADEKPVAIAAYQHVYDSAPTRECDLATALTMSTLFSHGAFQILAGEADRLLVDPYYVRNHKLEESSAKLLKNWYDFMVEHDELLFDPKIVDVTGSYSGGYNDDCDVSYLQTPVTGTAEAGTVWRRITTVRDFLIVHLINLVGQKDTLWDAPRNEPITQSGGVLRFKAASNQLPTVRVADPEELGRLIELPVTLEGSHAVVQLPELHIWQLILIEFPPATLES